MVNDTAIPAISREVEFIARNAYVADAVCEDRIDVPPRVKELTGMVCDRANAAVQVLLKALEVEVKRIVSGIVQIEWINKDRQYYWASECRVQKLRSRKSGVRWAGIYLHCGRDALRLIGWMYPKGGRDGRKKLARACDGVKVASECPKDYPAAESGLDSCVVWLDQRLSPATDRDELKKTVGLAAKRFFRVARGFL